MRGIMMRFGVMLALLVAALPAQADSNWDRLWFNADQRGEKLLQLGDAGTAARVYQDPRRRAYAEMKAGDYRQAAGELGKLHDSNSDYNRGNALAKLGDLKGALDAYDAALKTDPKNHDAQHNRDLVEKALQQQQPQQNQQQNGQQKDGKRDNKPGGKRESNSGGQGSQSGNNANGANDNSGQQSGKNENPGASGNRAQQRSNANNTAQSGRSDNQGRNGAAEAGRKQAATPGSPSANKRAANKQAANDQAADTAEKARQDAAAGLAANRSGAAGNRIANAAPPTNQTAPQPAPLSEQQLSKEQWLRNIPDDPGGLLRRKFMIEYMLRQQKAQQ